MTKKLILLILALPLFLMIILFTATSGVSLAVPIPVSKIEISGDDIIYMNMDDPDEQYQLDYMVYPTNAANKNVTVSYLPVVGADGEEETLAKFDYNAETGVLKPLAPGVAQVVITTVDGGYSDRITVVVETRELVSIDSSLPNLESVMDETLGMNKYQLEPGQSFRISNVFDPAGASNLLVRYSTSDSTVVTVDARGVISARSAGTAIITVTSRANEYISYSFAIEVKNPENQSIVIVDKDVIGYKSEGQIDMSITTEEDFELIYKVVDNDGNEITDAREYIYIEWDEDESCIKYYFADDEFYGTVNINVTLKTASGEETTVECSVTKVKLEDADKVHINFEQDAYELMYEQTNEIFFELLPANTYKDVEITITAANNDLFNFGRVTDLGDSFYSIVVTSKLIGAGDLKVTVKNNETGEITEKSVAIVVKPYKMIAEIVAEQQAFGIEGTYTIGKFNADGTLFEQYLNCTVDNIDKSFYENMKWVSSNDAVSVTDDGKIVFEEGKVVNEFVSFHAEFSYAGIKVSSQTIKIRCISNGYNVRTYEQLVNTVKDKEKIIVLQNDIVADFGFHEDKTPYAENELYEWMDSTYDVNWYINSGLEDEAKIKVLIKFQNDVYGNGHVINADNVVGRGQNIQYGETGQPILDKKVALFQGPLCFVKIAGEGSNLDSVSVAGQDNVVFAAFEGVTLNNVELIGRNIVPDENNNYNLQNLHYAGTTLEVFGDDVTLEYSRVKNGRNVIRAFGDFEDAKKVINFTIKNSVLSEGRDFIMRVGSNCFVDGNEDNTTPYLPGDDQRDDTDNVDYTVRHDYASLTDEQKAEYDAKFIKTFINIKNSVLQNPGIFAIGMDSHFSGLALANGDAFRKFAGDTDALKAWYNMAKTSYGAKLTLEGDVRMYCWKDLKTVDSSSLIEIAGNFKLGALNPQNLEFNVGQMVLDAASKNANLKNIVYNDGKINYVHAGIAFFGGGRNYGVLEDTNYAFRDYNAYEVSLREVGKPEFQLAAGNESFYFYIHDATTKGFLPEDQAAMLADNDEAYSCIYKK